MINRYQFDPSEEQIKEHRSERNNYGEHEAERRAFRANLKDFVDQLETEGATPREEALIAIIQAIFDKGLI